MEEKPGIVEKVTWKVAAVLTVSALLGVVFFVAVVVILLSVL